LAEGEDRTEAATPRRLARAREAGQVPLSREAAPAAVLAAVTLALVMLAPAAARRLAGQLALLLAGAHAFSPLAGVKLVARAGLFAAAPFMLVAALATIGAVLAQTGGLVHLGALAPDFSRLSPQRGLARIFSIGGLLEAGKALAKAAAAGAAAWVVLAGALPLLPTALAWDAPTLLAHTMHQAVRVLTVVIAVQAAIAGLDILHTRIRHAGEMRMSRHELREEHKETEGNPQIKARIRRLRMARVRRRMMAAVPKATVVVVNPTHYAVALSYQRGSTAAPRVVAKGVDEVAARIREVAEQNRVPLVANPPLARALHAIELDAEIPRELFAAVAELIAYVWRLRSRAL
jgi:flagellar biosynthetic protein FlhB